MADDRPVLTDVEQIATMQRQIDDLRSTVLARVGRSPTGTIEPTILTTPKRDTVFLQGQTLQRSAFPTLWQWASDNALVGVAGLFGAGDGSTTFALPDLRGRVLLGAGVFGVDTYEVGAKGGASTQVLAINQMPLHNHPTNSTGFTSMVADHGHGTTGNTNFLGQHGGHVNATETMIGYATAAAATWVRVSGWGSDGGHQHTVIDPTFGAGSHNHTIDASNRDVGGSTPLDVRQPYIAVNIMIWL